jgi:hypothetical protein
MLILAVLERRVSNVAYIPWTRQVSSGLTMLFAVHHRLDWSVMRAQNCLLARLEIYPENRFVSSGLTQKGLC